MHSFYLAQEFDKAFLFYSYTLEAINLVSVLVSKKWQRKESRRQRLQKNKPELLIKICFNS